MVASRRPLADRPVPSSARGERTRAKLVAAARAVFERDGYVESKLLDITALAEVSAGTFYTYFDHKEDILSAVFIAADEDMLLPGRRAAVDPDDPEAAIEAANRAYFEGYRRNAKIMLLMEQVAGLDPEFGTMRTRRGWAYASRNARRIADLQERGLADPDLDPLLAARALAGMVSRLAYYSFARGVEVDLDALTFTATRLWVNGIGLRVPHARER